MEKFTVSDVNSNMIDALYQKISPIAVTLCGEAERYSSNYREYVKFTLPKNYSGTFRNTLINEIANTLLFKLKYDFYGVNLPKSLSKDLFLLRRALIFSDFSMTVDLIKSSIYTFSDFYLDGIKNFLLRDELEEWNAISYATRKNAALLESKECYKKYLRRITSTILGYRGTLYVLDGENPCLIDGNLSKIDYGYTKLEGGISEEESFLASVIEHFPEKIVIYSKTLNKEISSALEVLF